MEKVTYFIYLHLICDSQCLTSHQVFHIIELNTVLYDLKWNACCMLNIILFHACCLFIFIALHVYNVKQNKQLKLHSFLLF